MSSSMNVFPQWSLTSVLLTIIQIQDLTELEDAANKFCLGYRMIDREIDNNQAGMADR